MSNLDEKPIYENIKLLDKLFNHAIDISYPISNSAVSWKDKYPIEFITKSKLINNSLHSTEISHLYLHTGTHIDSPAHAIDCNIFIDNIPIDKFTGHCVVIDLVSYGNVDNITADMLQTSINIDINVNDVVLLKTYNSLIDNNTFNKNFTGLSTDAAQLLLSKQIKAVGIDYLGIERSDLPGQTNHETHTLLLSHNILILEGLRLNNIDCSKHYYIIYYPLKLIGVEASPARAFLLPL